MIRLFRSLFPDAPATQNAHRSPAPIEVDRNAAWRDVIAIAVRETLRQQGIPATWITAETLSAATRSRQRGVHLRLIVREWRPELFAFAMALQKEMAASIAELDPQASQWLMGISWKFDLVDDTACPPLPGRPFWEGLADSAKQGPGDDAARRRAAAEEALAHSGHPLDAHGRHDDFRATEPMPVK